MEPTGRAAQRPLETLTHARIRAGQGDVSGARRLLRRILESDPGDHGARTLLAELSAEVDAARPEEREERPAPPVPADPSDLARRFRDALGHRPRQKDLTAERLRSLLERIRAVRGGDHA